MRFDFLLKMSSF